MGRLPAVTFAAPTCLAIGLAAALALAACDEPKGDLPPPPPTSGRSNAVAAVGDAGASPAHAPGATAARAAAAAPSGPPRQLCAGQSPRPAPKAAVKSASAPGAAPPPALAIGAGKWVWVNLWAAWCVPCREEMPRLLAWQDKLRAAGVLFDLAFVSLDDDERQLQRFLEGQTDKGVRATHWLPEGAPRTAFLGPLGLGEMPTLPAHAIIAPSGQLECVIQGAVEDRDYPAIASLLGARP